MKQFYLIALILFIACNNQQNGDGKLVENDPIKNELEIAEKRQDSIGKIRRLNNLNSIEYENKDRIFSRRTIDLIIRDFYDFKKYDIIQIEDYLVSKNWLFKSKNEIRLFGNSEKFKDVGKYTSYVYVNYSNDTEFHANVRDDGENSFQLYTLNPFNFKDITNQLNELGFSTEQGSIIHTSRTGSELVKNYVGEVVPIDFNTKIYTKNGFEITSSSYVNSIVTSSYLDDDSLAVFGYTYNANEKFNSFGFSF